MRGGFFDAFGRVAFVLSLIVICMYAGQWAQANKIVDACRSGDMFYVSTPNAKYAYYCSYERPKYEEKK